LKKKIKIFAVALFLGLFSLQFCTLLEAAPVWTKKDTINPARFARVAILPVINLQEDIDYANSIVFQKALQLFRYPDYEIYDNDRLYKALDEVNYYEGGKVEVTEEMLRTIMERAGLDMIVMVKLNELTQHPAIFQGNEALEELTLDMQFMAIYNWRPKIVNARITDKKTTFYAIVMKSDWKLQEFRNAVSSQLERIAKLGKK
jgi:hypothetical protein